MRIICLQHVPFESPGCIVEWADRSCHTLDIITIWNASAMPSLAEVDWLIVLGGPMSVNDEAKCKWLSGEKKLIEEAINAGKIVFGICLGAQMIADVLGARVYPNTCKEIGWFPVYKAPSASLWEGGDCLPPQSMAFHWHGETFDLPTGAIHLLRSDACANQGFAYMNRVVALQCHFEATAETVRQLIANCSHEIQKERWVQTPAEMRNAAHRFEEAKGIMNTILDYLERSWQKAPGQ